MLGGASRVNIPRVSWQVQYNYTLPLKTQPHLYYSRFSIGRLLRRARSPAGSEEEDGELDNKTESDSSHKRRDNGTNNT